MVKQRMIAGRVDLDPFFRPWIGRIAADRIAAVRRDRVFGDSFVRWHVMGESHYIRLDEPGAYAANADLTLNVVRDWTASRSSGSAFFSRVAAIITEADPSVLDLPAAWNTFCYSNFVQSPLLAPRLPPTAEQWAQARKCFFGQLAITRPTVLVVLGSRQWEQLPADVGAKLPPLPFEGTTGERELLDAWFYPYWIDDQLAGTIAVKVVHPSAGFGRWNWQIASRRAQTAMRQYSNAVEHVLANYEVG